MSPSQPSSIEQIGAAVQAGIEALPVGEAAAATEHLRTAEEIVGVVAGGSGAAALRGVQGHLAQAGERLANAQTHLQVARGKFGQYLGEISYGYEGGAADVSYPVGTFQLNLGEEADEYLDFEDAYSEEDRQAVYDLVISLAVDADGNPIPPEDILVSGFHGGVDPEDLAAIDDYKLSVASAVPEGGFAYDHYEEFEGEYGPSFGGDDSNAANVVERDIQGLREQKLGVSRQLERLGDTNAERRRELLEEITRLNQRIAELKAVKAEAALPIYYAGQAEELLEEEPEDNPLAYASFGDDAEQPPTLAIYDRRALAAAGITIGEKGLRQFRIYAHGADLMRHCVALVRLKRPPAADAAD
ncbi:MAG TPA: hypothetical protein VLH86_02075 [Patescibacteria group bacterium]|nr:hypothetical protein [Patescibacteria group bacterium]